MAGIGGAGVGFGVPLHAPDGPRQVGDALHRAVVQVGVRHAEAGRDRLAVHDVAVVLRGDGNAPGVEFEHRLVHAAVAEAHLGRAPARGQGQQLVAQADAEDGHAPGVQQVAHIGDGIAERRRVAGAVREQDAVGPQGQDLGGSAARRDHPDARAARAQVFQRAGLGAVIHQHDARGIGPRRGIPDRRGRRAPGDEIGGVVVEGGRLRLQVGDGGQSVGRGHGQRGGDHTLGPHAAGQEARVGADQRGHLGGAQQRVEIAAGVAVARAVHQFTGNHNVRPDSRALVHGGPDAVVAHQRVGKDQQLAAIGRVGERFLIADHAGLEDQFAHRYPWGARAPGADRRAVGHDQQAAHLLSHVQSLLMLGVWYRLPATEPPVSGQ